MQIVCPGRVTSLTTTPDGNYCIAAVSENIHIWQVIFVFIFKLTFSYTTFICQCVKVINFFV